MAIVLDGSGGDYYTRTDWSDGAPSSSHTVIMWARWGTVTGYQNIYYRNGIDAAQLNGNKLSYWNSSDNDGTTALSTNTWYHIAITKNSSTSVVLYINGIVEKTINTAAGDAASNLSLFAWNQNSDWPTGRFSNLLLYNVVLTQTEIQQQMHIYRPVRTLNLVGWYPWIDGMPRVVDYSGAGGTLTETGTITNGDGPPLSWGHHRLFYIPTYTESAIPTISQEGFRFRNDDGNETTATWKAAQDINITAPLNQNVRLRALLDTTGDSPSTQYQLEYRKVGDSDWRKVV